MEMQIRSGFFPAVPVLMDQSGVLDEAAQLQYANWLIAHDITGAAVWAHTGRGLLLSQEDRLKTAELWREQLGDKLLICGVGSAEGPSEKQIIVEALRMADDAKRCGADALLAFPPKGLAGPDATASIIRYHEALTQVGLPVIAFYLYEEAGGVLYTDELLAGILELDGVVGIKTATLDSVMRFQEIAHLMESFPNKALLTGEDRMFGYTLMRGATGALVGLGAVEVALQLRMFRSWQDGDYTSFVKISRLVDYLAESIFIQPMEGYVGRLLYLLSLRGIIPAQAAYDPWGPEITAAEQERIKRVLELIDAG